MQKRSFILKRANIVKTRGPEEHCPARAEEPLPCHSQWDFMQQCAMQFCSVFRRHTKLRQRHPAPPALCPLFTVEGSRSRDLRPAGLLSTPHPQALLSLQRCTHLAKPPLQSTRKQAPTAVSQGRISVSAQGTSQQGRWRQTLSLCLPCRPDHSELGTLKHAHMFTGMHACTPTCTHALPHEHTFIPH